MSWIKNTVLFSVSLGICVVLLIVGDWFVARTIDSALERTSFSEARQIEDIRKRDEDIPQREKAISEGFLPVVYPDLMDTIKIEHPLIAGLPLTNTYYCNEGYGLVRYRSDRFGFRNQDSIWDDDIKAIMIGDSFVHGACVSDNDTFPQKLSEKINSRVLNLGVGSNNPSHYFTYSHLFIPLLKPKIVYLNFYSNDNGEYAQSVIERKYVDENKKIFSNNGRALYDVPLFLEEGTRAIDLLRKKQQGKENVPKIGVVQRGFRSFMKHSTLPTIRSLLTSSSRFDQTEKAITKTLDLCNKFSCKVIVIFIPNSEYYRPDPRADNYGDKIAQLTSYLGISFVDGRDVISRKKGSRDFAIKGPHLSPMGYEKMALAIAETTP